MNVWVRAILYDLIQFYTILDTFMQFPLFYDLGHSYTVISKVYWSICDGVRVLL